MRAIDADGTPAPHGVEVDRLLRKSDRVGMAIGLVRIPWRKGVTDSRQDVGSENG
jgi:hypothetical protein